MEIKLDDLSGSEMAAFIMEHLAGMSLTSPPESIHALGLEELKKADVTVWSAWENGELLGCAALKELDETPGEIKSMRTSAAHLRKGVARQLLTHIIDEASVRGYARLSLETGSMEAFYPAQKLYESFGFCYCLPFADYWDDPNSVFMTMELGDKGE